MEVYWHIGEPGSGKSYTYVELSKKLGRDSIFMVTDYEGGGFDTYNAEEVIFLDEFRGQMPFYKLLHIIGEYTVPVRARSQNVVAIWTEVHITSVLPPERVYERMVDSDRDKDTFEQLKRRITHIVYHAKIDGEHLAYTISAKSYTSYNALAFEAKAHWSTRNKRTITVTLESSNIQLSGNSHYA